MTPKTRVAVVDNHSLVRHAVTKFINENTDRFTVTLECANGLELTRALLVTNRSSLPGIVVTDLNMPCMDGYETSKWVKANYPDIQILVVTIKSDEASIKRLFNLGISGYLEKNFDGDDLLTALTTVADGDTYFKKFSFTRTHPPTEKSLVEKIWDQLSVRDRQFVRLCTSELSDEQILTKIGIRPNTTEPYANKIFAKFGVKKREGLVMTMAKHRIFPFDHE